MKNTNTGSQTWCWSKRKRRVHRSLTSCGLRGIPALGFSPGKGKGDKITRMHMVAPLFEGWCRGMGTDKKVC